MQTDPLERNRRWYHRNKDAQRARSRENRRKRFAKDPKSVLAYNRRWAKNHPGTIKAKDAKRKALKRGAALENPTIIKKWVSQIRKLPFVRCYWCGTKIRGRNIHIDHVVALNLGGAHSISNLCASCQGCNCSKQDKAIGEWVRKNQLFLTL